jgi:hypothetical protein
MASRTKKKKKPAKPKKTARRHAHAKHTLSKKRSSARSSAPKSKRHAKKTRPRGKQQDENALAFEPQGLGPRSGGQSGDLQGLSDYARADAESVGELLEEGNTFEAEIIKGVEDVPDADEGEGRTREVPEDDVPEEYRDSEE